jgi:hypothetical protein
MNVNVVWRYLMYVTGWYAPMGKGVHAAGMDPAIVWAIVWAIGWTITLGGRALNTGSVVFSAFSPPSPSFLFSFLFFTPRGTYFGAARHTLHFLSLRQRLFLARSLVEIYSRQS